jgi:excisionase family DNA binding protein
VLTLTEAAEELGLAASTLRHQVQAGRLRARLIGKTYVVTPGELDRYRREHLGKPGRPSHRVAPTSTR